MAQNRVRKHESKYSSQIKCLQTRWSPYGRVLRTCKRVDLEYCHLGFLDILCHMVPNTLKIEIPFQSLMPFQISLPNANKFHTEGIFVGAYGLILYIDICIMYLQNL